MGSAFYGCKIRKRQWHDVALSRISVDVHHLQRLHGTIDDIEILARNRTEIAMHRRITADIGNVVIDQRC